jgi:hypothetical protein
MARTRTSAHWVVLAGLTAGLSLNGCGGHDAAVSPTAHLPAALVLRVDSLEVSSTAPGSQLAWDGEEPETDPGAGCKVLVAGISMFEPAVASASALCGLAQSPRRERHAQDPDLQVRLGVGAETAYTSWIDQDSSSEALRYEFVVLVAAVPPDGLRIDVLDDDGKLGAALVGSMRLARGKLIEGYESRSRLLVLSGGGVRRLEVVLTAYTDAPVVTARRRASDVPIELGRHVMAGEFVSVRASGTFKVGSYYGKTLDPAGYPGGDARSYNLGPFKKEPHACGIALIGTGQSVEGVPIGLGKEFVAGHAGAIRMGLNDQDLENNEGQVVFEVARRAPTAQEWLAGGRAR